MGNADLLSIEMRILSRMIQFRNIDIWFRMVEFAKYSDREILYSQDQNRLWYGRICFVEDNDNRFPHYNQDQYRSGPDQQISHVFQIQKCKYAPDPQTPNNITIGYNFVQVQLPINAHTAKQRL